VSNTYTNKFLSNHPPVQTAYPHW